MSFRMTALAMTASAALALGACDSNRDGNAATGNAANAEGENRDTIASSLGGDAKFAAAAKAAGLDGTLAGPGPYTVLVPNDAAFDKLPAGALDALLKADARTELTGVLSYHILPGTMLAADIGKAIDAGNGKTSLPTMGGGTITATKEGNAIVLADSAGTKARIVGDEAVKSNGVVHHIDTVLKPS
jgi:uncharacterized surface protein with fasciclin (FAS1) repeats